MNPEISEAPEAATSGASEPTTRQAIERGTTMTVPINGQCRHCTVPVDSGDTCAFCSSYVPPETASQGLDIAVNRIDLLRIDINDALRELATDAPLFCVVDIVTALGHLRQVSVLIDRVAASLDAEAVAR